VTSPAVPVPVVVAIGECGLDFFRNLSSREEQVAAFEYQISLAREFQLPLFVHDREASSTMLNIFRRIFSEISSASERTSHGEAAGAGAGEGGASREGRGEMEGAPLPPVVIHCFTGSAEEMRAYVSLGFYIGITGVICKSQRGKALREMLSEIPLDRLLVETDAPYMGFRKDRRGSEPADVVHVVEEIARVLGNGDGDRDRGVNEIREILYRNTVRFFRLPLPT
jgi:TatD DNase family protein